MREKLKKGEMDDKMIEFDITASSIGVQVMGPMGGMDDMGMNIQEIVSSMMPKKKKKRIILYLDEFQNISSFNKSLPFQKSLRAEWQNHKNVSYCMYGSKRHMMRQIFDKSEAPFYRFGSLFILDRIDTNHWISFIVSKFKESHKTINENLAKEIAELMRNHPHYVQQLAHFTWSFAGEEVAMDTINHALEFMVNSNSPLFILARIVFMTVSRLLSIYLP